MASGVTRICTLNLFSYHSSKILVTNCYCDGLNKIIWFLVRFLDLEKKKNTKENKFTNDGTFGHYFFERKNI